MSEQDVIRGCILENRECQYEVFRRYAGKMMTVCLRYAPRQMEAEDILQEAFIKVFDNIEKFEHKGSFEGWIRRIVINTALKKFQKIGFQQEQHNLEPYPELPIEPSVYATLHEEELLNLISRLPEGYRVVFNLYAIEGYSHKEIAEMLDIQESTSRSQLVKARKALQEQVLAMQKIAV